MTRLLKKLDHARKEGDLLRRSIVEKFVSKNEKGEWLQEDGNFVITDTNKIEFEKEMSQFMNLPVEIDYFKFKLIDMQEVKISAAEIMAIEMFIDEDAENTLQIMGG